MENSKADDFYEKIRPLIEMKLKFGLNLTYIKKIGTQSQFGHIVQLIKYYIMSFWN